MKSFENFHILYRERTARCVLDRSLKLKSSRALSYQVLITPLLLPGLHHNLTVGASIKGEKL